MLRSLVSWKCYFFCWMATSLSWMRMPLVEVPRTCLSQLEGKMPKTLSALSGDLAFTAQCNSSQNVLENGMTIHCHHLNTMGPGVPAPTTAQLYRNNSDLHRLLWGYLGSPNYSKMCLTNPNTSQSRRNKLVPLISFGSGQKDSAQQGVLLQLLPYVSAALPVFGSWSDSTKTCSDFQVCLWWWVSAAMLPVSRH